MIDGTSRRRSTREKFTAWHAHTSTGCLLIVVAVIVFARFGSRLSRLLRWYVCIAVRPFVESRVEQLRVVLEKVVFEDATYAHQESGVDALSRKDVVDVCAVAVQKPGKPGYGARARKLIKFTFDKFAYVNVFRLCHKGLF